MANVENMSYAEFCNWMDDSDDSEIVLQYDEYIVVKDNSTNRYWYTELSENDVSEFIELKLIGRLSYNFDTKVSESGLIHSHSIFPDCYVSGELFMLPESGEVEHLYFSRVDE